MLTPPVFQGRSRPLPVLRAYAQNRTGKPPEGGCLKTGLQPNSPVLQARACIPKGPRAVNRPEWQGE